MNCDFKGKKSFYRKYIYVETCLWIELPRVEMKLLEIITKGNILKIMNLIKTTLLAFRLYVYSLISDTFTCLQRINSNCKNEDWNIAKFRATKKYQILLNRLFIRARKWMKNI